MRFPVIVKINDTEELMILSSADVVARELEPPDVMAGLYEVFDSEGVQLEFDILDMQQRSFFGGNYTVKKVILKESQAGTKDQEKLRTLLLDRLRCREQAKYVNMKLIDSLSLEQLVAIVTLFALDKFYL